MKVLFAVKKGEPDYMETLITDKPDHIDRAKEWASKNGYDRFRISEIDLGTSPNFIQTIIK
jgi:hypothetical protein